MLRIACEIVCPSVLLLGEVVMEPVKVVPYFGTTEKPECHMLYNVTTMATTWHTLATGDVSLLRRQMEALCARRCRSPGCRSGRASRRGGSDHRPRPAPA